MEQGTGKEPGPETGCVRCGTCCEKGGPTLHPEDRERVESGRLPADGLYTIRKGELVQDPFEEALVVAASELIKLKGRGDTWCCLYFDTDHRRCIRYEERPHECRAMECWDPRGISAAYASPRLQRADLLSGMAGLWDLIEAHEERCGYGRLGRLAAAFRRGETSASEDLLQMIRYDAAVRELAVGKVGTDPAHLDFLFGRPLFRTAGGFGLRIEKRDGCDRITAAETSPADRARPERRGAEKGAGR